MASYFRHYNTPTGAFQRPNSKNESNLSHSNNTYEQNSSVAPFFLQRPVISSDIASKLIPIDVDLHTKKNMEEHSTNHYDISGLVLRRGQPFSFTVTFNKDVDPEQYQLFIRLAIGSRSMISKRTQLRLLVDGKFNENDWSAKSLFNEEEKKNRISFQVNSPSDAIIGKYTLLLEVRPITKDIIIDKQDLTLFLFEIDIYFLFNPWKKDDVCALSSSEQINEYVMNEHGQIYLGSSDKPQSIPWYYGQFERSVLLTALALLDQAQLPAQNRIDPSIILRILSSKICSNPGTNSGIFPSSSDTGLISSENGYTSSSAILKRYLASNGRSIQGGSGSNWLHAAILCSLSRSLGIPCRIVTIYNSACRADGTENNDIHWDTKQRPLKPLNSDFICSSHVWNECWMRRTDLSTNEQDWQIVDSTPVQMCDGIRRTGPCSVSSLKKGELAFRWDSPYIRSSIHGNKFHWIVYPDGNMELLDVEENAIGTKIITRSLTNEFQSEDLTDHYKTSIDKKDNFSERSKKDDDVNIELKIPNDIIFGDDIIIEFNAKNKSNEIRSLTTALTVYIMSNNGQRLFSCYDYAIQNLNLESGKDGSIQLKIRSEEYINYVKQENISLKYYIHSQIKETNQIFVRDDNIVFSKDDIIKPILDEDVIEIGKPVLLRIQIANTFSRPLHNGRVYIDGLGINQILYVNRSFAPKESTIFHTKLYPTRIGVSRLYVTFISDNVCSLTQSIPLEILLEPIKKRDEPLLKNDTGIPTKTDDKSEIKEKETVTETITHDNQDESPMNEKENPLSPTGNENHDKNLPKNSPTKPDLSTTEDEDVEEPHLKNKPANPDNNPSIGHGSTLSLDKDKMSIDSLDISNDRRHISNHN